MIQSINPANGEIFHSYNEMSENEINDIIISVEAELKHWQKTTFAERSRLMKSAAEILRKRKKEYARLMTLEMGKTFVQAEAEVEKCAWACDYFAENSIQFLKDELIQTDASKSFVTYQPLGVVLAIMPWNFPFWQVIRFAAPNLMAGNAGVLKHASNVTGTALALEQIFRDAGFPENLFRTLILSSKNVEKVIKNEKI